MDLLLVTVPLLIPPVAIVVFATVVLAGLGTSLGLREKYVDLLIKIFEWGATQIKQSNELKRQKDSDESLDPESEDEGIQLEEEDDSDDIYDKSSTIRKTSKNLALKSSARCRKISITEHIISKERELHPTAADTFTLTTYAKNRGQAAVADSLYYIKAGIEAIVEDEVTRRFKAAELPSWNMMTRTMNSAQFYNFINWKLSAVWILGFIFRYAVLVPIRIIIFYIGLGILCSTTALLGVLPEGPFKRWLNQWCMLASFRVFTRAVSAVVYFHDRQNKAKNGGICVANHTSPLDVMILSMDNVYAMVGQRQGGALGFIQRTLSRAAEHIWFERAVANDRLSVLRALKEHVEDPNKLPILIFPEGTCINNTSVMQFKKGSFEVGAIVYPIAMKYDTRFGDAFWNSSEQSYGEYFFRLMTSWATVCHVWYLPPMEKLPGEDAIEFANRVKKAIAEKGGLVDLEWDGQLKRYKVPQKLVALEQGKCAERLSHFPVNPSDSLTELEEENFHNAENGNDESTQNEGIQTEVEILVTDVTQTQTE